MTENKHTIRYRNLLWLFVSVIVILLDRLAKLWAMHHLPLDQPVYVLPFFNWTLAYNKGAAFSMLNQFQGGQRWFLGIFCIVISIGIIVWLLRLTSKRKWLAFALALILGGGLANLWDRITLGYVIDFIQWHVHQWSWPIFNVGDSAITVGTVILVIDIIWGSGNSKKSNAG